jgi:hypothetical protein
MKNIIELLQVKKYYLIMTIKSNESFGNVLFYLQ